jgi:hypothetical protein
LDAERFVPALIILPVFLREDKTTWDLVVGSTVSSVEARGERLRLVVGRNFPFLKKGTVGCDDAPTSEEDIVELEVTDKEQFRVIEVNRLTNITSATLASQHVTKHGPSFFLFINTCALTRA